MIIDSGHTRIHVGEQYNKCDNLDIRVNVEKFNERNCYLCFDLLKIPCRDCAVTDYRASFDLHQGKRGLNKRQRLTAPAPLTVRRYQKPPSFRHHHLVQEINQIDFAKESLILTTIILVIPSRGLWSQYRRL